MRGVKPALDELVELLRDAGFRAAIDPDRLVTDPACVWVQPREIRDRTLDGGGTLVVWLYLIVANVETEQAVTLLDDALSGVLALDDLVPSDSDDVIDLSAAVLLPGNPTTPLPAYRVAVDLDL